MENTFGSAFRSFWHTMTSNDRHSTLDSPYRTGRHVPLQNGRNGILTGVATASDSRPDVSMPYFDETSRSSGSRTGSPKVSGTNISNSPTARAYSPGLRSISAQNATKDGFEVQTGDVPMQSFENGLPPPPPVMHSWRRIDTWAEENYPELFDQLGEGATSNDLNDVEHQLDCSLPQDVRESLMHHDGQERGGNPTGIIFGSMLMDCEEIVQEYETWRKVNHEFMLDMQNTKPHTSKPSIGGSSEASSSKQRPSSSSSSNAPGEWRNNLLSKQDCVPPNTVQKAYAHAGWVPLVRDWGGNNLAVDLAPGPTGRYGQIILFGRDYDTKYVVARSWAAFLALVADDLSSGKWFVDEETNELKLREFKDARVEPSYFNILRWRMDQKYGRRATRRKSQVPSKTGSPLGSRSASPYASPADGDARGRSMQRHAESSPLTSPKRPSGPAKNFLTRVTEETVSNELADAIIEPSNLVDVDDLDDIEIINHSPRGSVSAATPKASSIHQSESGSIKGKETTGGSSPDVSKAVSEQLQVVEGGMKTIEI